MKFSCYTIAFHTNLMENHPQWEAPCPPDLILYKEQDEEYAAEQDEQEYGTLA